MRYGILFELEIAHDYFLNLGDRVHEALDDDTRGAIRREYSIPALLELRPTPRTRERLAGHQLISKTTTEGLRVAVHLDEAAPDSRPAVPLGDDFRLVFALTVTDPAFHNYTALAESADGFYYFDNGSGNETAAAVFLSQPVAPFDTTRRYEASEVRAEPGAGVTDLFQAVRDTGPAPAPVALDWERIPADTFDPTATYTVGAIVLSANLLFRALVDDPGDDLTDPGDWEPLGALANQYVTRDDGRRLVPTPFSVDVAAAALTEATVRLFEPGEAQPILEQGYVAESGTLDELQVDAQRLASGPYRLEILDAALSVVPDLGAEIYLDSDAVHEGWFGVVEIGPGSGGLALLDGSGALRSPRYTVRFLNRATRCRYVFPQPQQIGVGAEVAPEAGAERNLVTPTPRPLTRFGGGVRLQDDLLVLLPEPEALRIRRQSDQWFSEIHTSNLPI